jgi:hypothetical protein
VRRAALPPCRVLGDMHSSGTPRSCVQLMAVPTTRYHVLRAHTRTPQQGEGGWGTSSGGCRCAHAAAVRSAVPRPCSALTDDGGDGRGWGDHHSHAPAALASQRRGYAKELRFGVECRNSVLAGADKLADAVQVTLGPKVRRSRPPGSPLCGMWHDIRMCLR